MFPVQSTPKTLTTKAVVFDLDQTLVATQEDYYPVTVVTDNPQGYLLESRLYQLETKSSNPFKAGWKFWGVTRPYTREFLEFAFTYFRVVGVWSAGTADYVAEIVKYLFPPGTRQPHVIFTRDDIVANGETDVGKPLAKLYSHNEVFERYMNEKNTMIIDDNPSTSLYNKANIVNIPRYEPACGVTPMLSADFALQKLQRWLLLPEVMSAPDVQLLDKTRIFT